MPPTSTASRAARRAAEELGDAELTARLIGAYDVPTIWTRVDDPEQAAQVVTAAERALSTLPPGGHEKVRARLLATIAVESRGTARRADRRRPGRQRRSASTRAPLTASPNARTVARYVSRTTMNYDHGLLWRAAKLQVNGPKLSSGTVQAHQPFSETVPEFLDCPVLRRAWRDAANAICRSPPNARQGRILDG